MDSPVFPLTLAFIVITYLIKVISERITFFFKSNVKYLVLDFLGKIILIAKIFETKRECNNFGQKRLGWEQISLIIFFS